MQSRSSTVVTSTTMTEFFQHSVTAAMSQYKLTAAEETVCYVVRLLTAFARSDGLFERTSDGLALRPLASFYVDAVEAPSSDARDKALRRLGDVALFVAGVFAQSLSRKIVDLDYYIAMGGNAYAYLASSTRSRARAVVLGQVFEELAAKFSAFVDVLGEITDGVKPSCHADILRLYEVWMSTGSPRAARKLNELGIHPMHVSPCRSAH
jgi:hypothetical protein